MTEIETVIMQKASSDGSFAIAYALMKINCSLEEIANSIFRLGCDPDIDVGAIQLLSNSISKIANAIEGP